MISDYAFLIICSPQLPADRECPGPLVAVPLEAHVMGIIFASRRSQIRGQVHVTRVALLLGFRII